MSKPTAIALRREPGAFTRSLVALSLRVALGLIFLTAGLTKFHDIRSGKYPGYIIQMFEKTPLKPELVRLFATALPYAEVGVGVGLIAGILTTLTAIASAALLINLLFGQTVLQKSDMYPTMLIYILVNAGILWLSPVTSNYLSVDGILFGWFWAPRGDGAYHAEENEKIKPAKTRQ